MDNPNLHDCGTVCIVPSKVEQSPWIYNEESDGADSFLIQVCLCGVLCQL